MSRKTAYRQKVSVPHNGSDEHPNDEAEFQEQHLPVDSPEHAPDGRKQDELESISDKREQRQLRKNLNDMKDQIGVLTSELDGLKSKELGVLAIFGALFTFVSVQFQLQAIANKAVAVFIGGLSLGGLLLFCAVLLLAASVATARSFFNFKVFLSFLLIAISCTVLLFTWRAFSVYLLDQDTCSYMKERIGVEANNLKSATSDDDKDKIGQKITEIKDTYKMVCD